MKLCALPEYICVIMELLLKSNGNKVGFKILLSDFIPVLQCSFQPQAQRVLSVAKHIVCSDPNAISFTSLPSEIIIIEHTNMNCTTN